MQRFHAQELSMAHICEIFMSGNLHVLQYVYLNAADINLILKKDLYQHGCNQMNDTLFRFQ